MKTVFLLAAACQLASAAIAAETLDIYVVDSEGGKSMVMLTPTGEAMLVDGGYPSRDDRDTKRIVTAAEALGIKQFDYVLVTHYDFDHVGNIPHVDTLLPAKVFIDHSQYRARSGLRSEHSAPITLTTSCAAAVNIRKSLPIAMNCIPCSARRSASRASNT
jgi:glyoxylase-like metal-dependent hydrolase (beta-lactamase superfamily II)